MNTIVSMRTIDKVVHQERGGENRVGETCDDEVRGRVVLTLTETHLNYFTLVSHAQSDDASSSCDFPCQT